MSSFLIILMLISMLLVLVSLILGIFVMAKGGEYSKKYSNKLMRARVYLQGLALGLFILAYLSLS